MSEIKTDPKSHDYDSMERLQTATEEIEEEIETLLTYGGKITDEGQIFEIDAEIEQEAYIINPGSIAQLSYWMEGGNLRKFMPTDLLQFAIGNDPLRPQKAIISYTKNRLDKEGLLLLDDGSGRINPRFKTDRFAKCILADLADTKGLGQIKKPSKDIAA